MPLWYQNYYIWSHVWDVCEVTVILVNSIIMRSQCCHSMMSHMHKMTTSPWGRSVGTVWCHRYWRWSQHHEVTVLSQDNAHHVRVIMMSLCFRNYDISSQWYKLTASPWAHMQCCQRTMLTMWGHFDVPMISKLWHHMCELFVRSCWYKLTASPWGHSVVTGWCPPCEAILMSLWYRNYDITYVSCLWGHGDTSWPHHHEVKGLSQDDAHHVRLFWCPYDIKIMTSHMWVVCEVMVIQVDRITMRSKCCHRMMLTMWGYFDVPMISKLWHQMCELFVRSCWYKLTVSPWGHRMMLTMLGHFDVTMISKLWHHICELFVRSCGYKLTASPCITMRSQDDAHHVRSFWCPYEIKIMTSHMWVVCEVMLIQADCITMRSQDDAHHVRSFWCPYDIKIMTSNVWVVCEVMLIQADCITMRSQDDAHHVRSFWCPYDIEIMTSHMWVVCEVTVIDHITMM